MLQRYHVAAAYHCNVLVFHDAAALRMAHPWVFVAPAPPSRRRCGVSNAATDAVPGKTAASDVAETGASTKATELS